MAWLTEEQRDNIMSHIITDEVVLSRKYKSKKKEFEEDSVEINEIEQCEKDGWEVISKSKKESPNSKSQKAKSLI
ncbi:MAG: hypothetical protein K2O88_08625 [Paramuribaculum sp.]|nr:hypothetical protein [Paramuribaculum sp.]